MIPRSCGQLWRGPCVIARLPRPFVLSDRRDPSPSFPASRSPATQDRLKDLPPGNPVRARQRHACHRRRLDRQRHKILRLEIVHVALAAGAGDGLRLERQHGQIVGEPPSGRDRIEARRELGILRGDAGRVAALVPVVVAAGRGAELAVLVLPARDRCRRARSAPRCRSRPRRRRAPAPWPRRRRCGCRPTRSAAPCGACRAPAAPAPPGGWPPEIGMPTCSMNTSCVAAVPPCMPSSTTTSAPAFTASAVS